MEFIDLNKSDDDEAVIKRVKVFCMTNQDDIAEYQEILNSEDKKIYEEGTPSLDKMGRMMMLVRWTEPA